MSETLQGYPMDHCRFYGTECARGHCLDDGSELPKCYKPRWTKCPRCGGDYDHVSAMYNIGCLCETDIGSE